MRRAAGMVLVGVAMTVLTACGAGSSKASSTPNQGGNSLQAYMTCLSDNGVKLPSFGRPSGLPSVRGSGAPRPSGSPGGFGGGFGGRDGGGFFDENNPPDGVDAATWKAAVTACASKRPTFNGGNQNNSQFTAYRNCLQDHGVTISQGSNLSTSDPKTEAALKTCAPLRPTPNFNRSAPASPTS